MIAMTTSSSIKVKASVRFMTYGVSLFCWVTIPLAFMILKAFYKPPDHPTPFLIVLIFEILVNFPAVLGRKALGLLPIQNFAGSGGFVVPALAGGTAREFSRVRPVAHPRRLKAGLRTYQRLKESASQPRYLIHSRRFGWCSADELGSVVPGTGASFSVDASIQKYGAGRGLKSKPEQTRVQAKSHK